MRAAGREWNAPSALATLGVAQSFLLAFVCLRRVFAPGYLLHSDFVTPLRYTPAFFSRFYTAWDPVTGGFSYSAPKLSLQAGVATLVWAGLSTATVYKLLVVGVLGLTGATMFGLVYWRARAVAGAPRAYVAATLGSVLFVTNPWTVNKIHHHLWLVLGVALLPVVYALYRRALDGRDGLATLLALSVLFAVEATQPHSLFVYVAPVCLFAAAAFLAEAPSVERVRTTLRVTGKLAVLALLVNAFWVVPLALFYANRAPTPSGYLLTAENVASLSRHASMLRVTQLRSGLGMKGLLAPGFSASYRTGVPLLDRLWPVAGVVTIAVALTALLGERGRRDRVAFAGVAVVALVLATGTKPPFGEAYSFATLRLPLGWMLRDPFKFGGLFAFALAALFGLAVADLLAWLEGAWGDAADGFRRLYVWPVEARVRVVPGEDRPLVRTTVSAALVAALVLPALFHGWPAFTGDVNGHFEPTTVPDQYAETLDWLAANADGARVLWLPYDRFSVADPRVYRYDWTTGEARWHVRGSKFLEFSTPGHVLAQSPRNQELLMWLHDRLTSGAVATPSVSLRQAGVGYVVVHTDVSDRSQAGTVLRRLRADPAITEVHRAGAVHVLRVRDASLVRAGRGLETYDLDTLAAWNASGATGASPAFTLRSNVSARNGLVTDGSASALYLGCWTTVAPFDDADHYRPATGWSMARTHDPWQGRWHQQLARRGIQTWQTDFGRGIAFTWAERRAPDRVTPPSSDRLGEWRFVGARVPPGWESEGGTQAMRVRHGHLSVTRDAGSVGRTRVVSPPVSASPSGVYRFAFDVRGRDARDVTAAVAEYDASGRRVHVRRVATLGDGTFDRDGVTVDYVPRNESTAHLRLVLRRGSRDPLAVPSEVRLDDVRAVDVTSAARAPTLRANVTVDRSGTYRLVGRYLVSRDGGRMRVGLDGRSVAVDTNASVERFVWRTLATRRLTAGTHALTLRNEFGFGAVNLLVLAPADALDDRRSRLDERLRDRSVTYALDARSLRRRNVRDTVGSADGRRALSLRRGGRAWRRLDVLASGRYTLSARGTGAFVVRVDGDAYQFDGESDGRQRLGAVFLPQGSHRVSVVPVDRRVAAVDVGGADAVSNATDAFAVSGSDRTARDAGSLRLTTNATRRGWSWAYTRPVNATPGRTYTVETTMAYRNANQSHAVVQGYDRSRGAWRRLGVAPSGRVGTADWDTYRTDVTVPDGVDELRVALNAGWVANRSAGPATTWFDDVTVWGVRENAVEGVSLSRPAPTDGPARDGGDPATVLGYRELTPTTYRVRVNASRPYLLSFGQDYDPLWVAEVETDDGVRRYDPTPVATAATGFWVPRTGEYTVTIRYRGQRWLLAGAAVSAPTVLACLALVGYRRRRRWRPRLSAVRERAAAWASAVRDGADRVRDESTGDGRNR